MATRTSNTVAAETPDGRSAGGHIDNIRGVFKPTVTDLADLFGVSRQTIYKWQMGKATPTADKLGRIRRLSRAADEFLQAGVSWAKDMHKMKAFAGRSLLDLFKSGEDAPEHTAALIAEAKAMESARLRLRRALANSKSTPADDWKTDISIAGGLEP